MSQLIPNRFLFKFEFPILRCKRPVKLNGRAAAWDKRYLLPPLHTLDGQSGFARVFAAWDDTGLFVGCHVEGKSRPPACDPDRFRQSDNLRVMTDMRDTRTIHRATRFCQQFYFLPSGGGRDRRDPVAGAAKVPRAQDDAPLARAGDLSIAAETFRGGYSITAHLPATVLNGFDPAVNNRIGFFSIVEDTELGHQSLTVDDDLNWWMDPSAWPTAVLTEERMAKRE